MSNLKKVVALALALALVMTMFAGATIKTDLPFKDVAEFTEAQRSAAALLNPLGVLSGTGAGELGAGGLTRAQMVTFVYRLVNGGDYGVQNYYSKTSVFPDVDPEAWYAPYINWAYAAKVVEGYGTNFGPEDPVTGVQAAAMLVRLLGKDDARGADYALKTQAYAIGFGLDAGIETQGLYEKELARGDMFILLANTLLTPVKGETIAEKIFDLEIINGAILLGMDSIGSNGYSVFAFRTETSGNVQYFWTDLLCVEEDSAVFDDYGCKYTLLVSKNQINAPTYNQGYRWLYAAYEETQNNYYKVVTGTVDDGTMRGADGVLVYTKDGKAVPLDKNVFVYVNGKAATVADFIASLGVRNMARYKLIDNDGDGAYEFIIVERYALKDIATETINAKVTAVSADGGTITLTKADGTAVTVKLGNFWNAKYEVVENNIYKIWNALGINQDEAADWNQPNYGIPYFGGYMPFTAISDVYYDFVIGGGYLFDMKVSENTKFAGSYGIMVAWSSPITFYKNMPYALFVNEKSEYFWAYVQTVDEAPAMTNWTFVLDNTLVYFTDGDASDDVVSFDTAGFWNSNYTYKELMLAYGKSDTGVESKTKIKFEMNVWSIITDKTTNYSKLVENYPQIYAIFDIDPADPKGDGSEPAIRYWDAQADTEVDCPAGTAFSDALDRKIDGLRVLDYKELKGKYYVAVDATSFYGIRALDECKGFIYVTDDSMEVTIKNAGAEEDIPESLQIYRRNGFWHLRFYTEVSAIDVNDLVVTYMGYPVEKIGDVWCVLLPDEKDPLSVDDEEQVPLYEFVKGFDATTFEEAIEDAKEALATDGDEIVRSQYTLLNTAHGVVFAYGDVVEEGATVRRWVAYDIDTFDSDFGYGDLFYMIDLDGDGRKETRVPNDTVPFGYTADELIYAKVGGTMYVKALKVSDYMGTLPYGWLAPNGYELVVFGGFAGGVNTNGWGIKLASFDGEKIKVENVYTKIGLNGAVAGDVLLVKRDANGNLTELLAVGDTVWGYLDYATSYSRKLLNAPLVSATKISGNDSRGDHYEVNLTGKTVYYMWVNDAGELLYTDDFSKVPAVKDKTPYVDVWSVGKVYVAFVQYYA